MGCLADLLYHRLFLVTKGVTSSHKLSPSCVIVWASTKLHLQSDGLVEKFNRTLAEEFAIVTSKCQHDLDSHLPLVLMACHSGVHVQLPQPS